MLQPSWDGTGNTQIHTHVETAGNSICIGSLQTLNTSYRSYHIHILDLAILTVLLVSQSMHFFMRFSPVTDFCNSAKTALRFGRSVLHSSLV